MADLSREEFLKLKEEATKQMHELYGGRALPPFPDFVSVSGGNAPLRTQASTSSEVAAGQAELNSPPANREPQRQCTPVNNQNKPLGILSGLNLKGLMSNPDNLLIIGLLLVLLSDNADEKLILALIFIML